MKRILGLDLGVASIGWALVNEAESSDEQSSIVRLGVRVNPLSQGQDGEKDNFEKGKSVSTNSGRTQKRSMRRNLQRFKLRRTKLIDCLKRNNFINDETILHEQGNRTTFETYMLRARAATEQVSLEELARVLLMLNKKRGYRCSRKDLSGNDSTSVDKVKDAEQESYLAKIEHRSKELEGLTVGQYLMNKLKEGPNYSFKNKIFYRSDYLHEFEVIWKTQSQFHRELSFALKKEIRDKIIFYQRRLKSQKGRVNYCELERWSVVDNIGKTRIVGAKVCPKSSPLFQEFKIWQILNNVIVTDTSREWQRRLEPEEKDLLWEELNLKHKLTRKGVLKLLFNGSKSHTINFEELDGNKTQATLFSAYQKIIERRSSQSYNFAKMKGRQIMEVLKSEFVKLGFDSRILSFDSSLPGAELERQPMYRLWHLLYSYEGDTSESGIDNLKKKIMALCNMDFESAEILANVVFEQGYGSLSVKAMRRILPYMKVGNDYSTSCEMAGYRHSRRSLTKSEIESKQLVEQLPLLPHNSLRNPVVEKILNQMVNVVNEIIICYGRPDEIRLEMSRSLKSNAKQREKMSNDIRKNERENKDIDETLKKEFGLKYVSRNDRIRYKLYKELEKNGYRTLYSDTYISKDNLFNKEFDIEHIIPQASLFDDSLSNKTLESRSVNIEKGNRTAFDYVCEKYGDIEAGKYKSKVMDLPLSDTKKKKLLMSASEIPSDFLARDLNNTSYIARKAVEMLENVVKTVVTTTGSITAQLREDWQLVDVIKELDWDKYNKLGMTEVIQGRDGQRIRRINDWSKRDDHRHHAMDALVIAFTRRSMINYFNNLKAHKDEDERCQKRIIVVPMPINIFRTEAKKHLGSILISIKSKNKVMTSNVNKIKRRGGIIHKVQPTPRGQLHDETIYRRVKKYSTVSVNVGGTFDKGRIMMVANKEYREALLARLDEYGGDAKKAFTGKNSLEKNPVYVLGSDTRCVPSKVKIVMFKYDYTSRKEISPTLNIDKVLDKEVKETLMNRLNAYDGKDIKEKAKKAFVNLDENPIYLKNGNMLKRVSVSGISNGVALHDKKDYNGKHVCDSEGNTQPADFVSTGKNHHVAVYRDAKGNLQSRVMSFFEATARVTQGLPAIDRDYRKDDGWQFLFTMKRNEYFVFPDEDSSFDPNNIDLMDERNYPEISKHLYRVQKLRDNDYWFRHHLETSIKDDSKLKGMTYKRINSIKNLERVVKVRVNHIGQIVSVGEY